MKTENTQFRQRFIVTYFVKIWSFEKVLVAIGNKYLFAGFDVYSENVFHIRR